MYIHSQCTFTLQCLNLCMHLANYGSLAYHKHNGHLICEHKLSGYTSTLSQ